MTTLLILRGINGGSYHHVPMAALREYLTKAEFTRVSSYATSGNLLFESSLAPVACKQRVADTLATHFDFPINFGIFDGATILSEMQAAPDWWDGQGHRQHMCLFKLTPAIDLDGWLRERLTPLDHVATTAHLIFWTVDTPGDFRHSAYGRVFGTPFYRQTSTRSYRTTHKLAQLLRERED